MADLDSCVDDARDMHDAMIKTIGVKPENILVMASKSDFEDIVRRIDVKVGEGKPGGPKFFDAPTQQKADEWLAKPNRNVPEDMLPALKAKYLCYSINLGDNVIQELADKLVPEDMRADPSMENFKKAMDKFVVLAKANPTRNYLYLQCFSGHGFHDGGFQHIPTPYYNHETKFYSVMPVEKLIREYCKGLKNVYICVFFAACREVRNLSNV